MNNFIKHVVIHNSYTIYVFHHDVSESLVLRNHLLTKFYYYKRLINFIIDNLFYKDFTLPTEMVQKKLSVMIYNISIK